MTTSKSYLENQLNLVDPYSYMFQTNPKNRKFRLKIMPEISLSLMNHLGQILAFQRFLFIANLAITVSCIINVHNNNRVSLL